MKRDLWTVLLTVVIGLALLVGMTGAVGAQDPKPGAKVPKQLELGEPLQAAAAAPGPLTTAFTYQGLLKSTGNPINGTVDMQFSVWDQVTLGLQIGGVQTVLAVSVVNGVFTVRLNDPEVFVGAFNGQARWLEIAVRSPAGVGAYTTLTPRQEITAVPYALALAPNSVLLNNNDSTFYLSPYDLVNMGGPDMLLTPNVDGSMQVSTFVDVTTTMALPADVVASLFGSSMYIKSCEICYSTGGNGTILATNVNKSDGVAGIISYIADPTVRTATTRTCYVLTAPLPRQPINATSWIAFDVNFIQDVLAPTITFYSGKLTISESPN